MLRADQAQLTAAASRRVTGVLAAPQTVDVVDEFHHLRRPSSLPDRLRYQVGVDVVQHRHGHYDVGLRGSVRTLGQPNRHPSRWPPPQTQQLGSQWWVGYINMSDIERVDIVRGPASVSYGLNAFGGAILDHHPQGARHTAEFPRLCRYWQQRRPRIRRDRAYCHSAATTIIRIPISKSALV